MNLHPYVKAVNASDQHMLNVDGSAPFRCNSVKASTKALDRRQGIF